MRPLLSSVVPHTTFPPLSRDLFPLAPLLRRLFSKSPVDETQVFEVGTLRSPNILDVSGTRLPRNATRALVDAMLAHGDIRSFVANRCALGPHSLTPLTRLIATSTSLAVVQVRENHFDAAHAQAILRAAVASKSLRSLSFAKDPLGDVVARGAAQLLGENSHLQSLALDDNGLSPVGVRAVAEALELHNQTLHSLSLARTPLDVDAARALASAQVQGCSLRELILRDSELGDAQASALARGVGASTHLRHLDLCGHALGDVGVEAISDAIGGHRSLLRVDLGSGRTTTASSVSLRGARALALAITENNTALVELRVHAPDDDVALILLDAVEKSGRAVALDLGAAARVRIRRRARRVAPVRGARHFSPASPPA